MQIASSLHRLLAASALAALFVGAPFVTKFDQTGHLQIVSAMAQAQEIPDPIDPIDGPIDPPTDCVGDCGPPTEPVDPPTEPVDPPTEPVDPPTEPVDPPTEPVDPPTEPVDPPIDSCDQKGAPDKCFDPEPVATPSPSDDDDDEPANPPVAEIPAGDTPRQEGLDFVETVRCQTACTASVTGDGEVTVTVTSTTTGGETVKTTITQGGDQVATRVVLGREGDDKIIVTAEETFESEEAARDEVVERVVSIPVTLILNVDFPEVEESQGGDALNARTYAEALADALGIDAIRIDIASLTAG